MPCYVVIGYLGAEDKELHSFYVGTSPEHAFKYFFDFSLEADLTIKIWEDNRIVATIKQKDYVDSLNKQYYESNKTL